MNCIQYIVLYSQPFQTTLQTRIFRSSSRKDSKEVKGSSNNPAGSEHSTEEVKGSCTKAAGPDIDVCAASFFDVAVMRCLFISHWPEEGAFWALQYLYHRLQNISERSCSQQHSRRRSNSLPIPTIEISLYQSPEIKKKENKDFIEVPEIKDINVLAGN